MTSDNLFIVRLLPDLLINFFKILENKISILILNSKEFIEVITYNAIHLKDGNAVPYFVLLELYLINNIKGNSNECYKCIEKN